HSFFAALKNERVYRTTYPSKKHARKDIVRYIEGFYNSRRRHSELASIFHRGPAGCDSSAVAVVGC
ncbi:IS3 family transposase, partial [Pseudoclavibacter helvolus]|uniref:IS3 family transposase n=1 Tax=Pseudoclavibacter helvolus TaxID=255205 RepID=UPI001F446C87